MDLNYFLTVCGYDYLPHKVETRITVSDKGNAFKEHWHLLNVQQSLGLE